MAATVPTRRRKVSREPLSLFPDTLSWCSACARRLSPEAFNRDKKNKDGFYSICRECTSAKKKTAYPRSYPVLLTRHRERTYGIAAEAFTAMVAAQGNRCAICDKDMGEGRDRNVDHDHLTGLVRALLCNRCNGALGLAGDDPERLRAMADYIERYRSVE